MLCLEKCFLMVIVRNSFLGRKLVYQGASKKFISFEKFWVFRGKYKKFLDGLGDRIFQTKAKKPFLWKKLVFGVSLRKFFGKNFFFWVGQVGVPDESIFHL